MTGTWVGADSQGSNATLTLANSGPDIAGHFADETSTCLVAVLLADSHDATLLSGGDDCAGTFHLSLTAGRKMTVKYQSNDNQLTDQYNLRRVD